MITQPAIQLIVNDLAVLRGTRIVFEGLTLSVKAGQALTVIGPNGAGKTTLLRCIAGFLPAANGMIRLEGADDERSIGEHCHYVGHLNGIKPALTVSENLVFATEFLNADRQNAARAAEQLALAELEDIPAGYLSAGQKRRLGLARLVCAPRPLWLLDEPAVSLDTASQGILGSLVSNHLGEGGIVLAVTHAPLGWSQAEIFNFSDIVVQAEAGLE